MLLCSAGLQAGPPGGLEGLRYNGLPRRFSFRAAQSTADRDSVVRWRRKRLLKTAVRV